MEQEKIRELLDRYFEGKTSEEEELLLTQYLCESSTPEDLKREAGYLIARKGSVPEPSEEFFDRLEAVTHPVVTVKPAGRIRRYIAVIGSAAAVVTGLWLGLRPSGSPQAGDSFDDPVLALAEVRAVLMTVSVKMNSGAEQIDQVRTIAERPVELEGFSRIGDIVGKNLSRLRYLGEMNPVQDETETDK